MNNSKTLKVEELRKSTVINKSPKERYICYNDIIGRGTYKIVYRGYDTNLGKEVAWNLIHFDKLSDSDKNCVVDEVNLLKQLSSQNKYIIQFHNAWIDKNGDLIIITELALSGTLKDYISKINNVKLRVLKKWGFQILEGLIFLHEQNIAHRDLKCNNIFINSNTGDIIIGDLGLAKHKNVNYHSVIGTPEYMAPEMFDEIYDEKVDIYSFGMCLLEMITKNVPYLECTGIGSVYKKKIEGILPDALFKLKNENVKNIIQQCIQFDPNKRPTAKELLLHPFFQISDNDNEHHHTRSDTDNNISDDDVEIISSHNAPENTLESKLRMWVEEEENNVKPTQQHNSSLNSSLNFSSLNSSLNLQQQPSGTKKKIETQEQLKEDDTPIKITPIKIIPPITPIKIISPITPIKINYNDNDKPDKPDPVVSGDTIQSDTIRNIKSVVLSKSFEVIPLKK
jgi:serine/threonine protein kinase